MFEPAAVNPDPSGKVSDRKRRPSSFAGMTAPLVERLSLMRSDLATDSRIFDAFGMLRFPLIVLVVYGHNASIDTKYNGFSIGANEAFFLRDYIIAMISQGWVRVAVPLFYFMSGYLFFLNVNWSLDVYVRKLKGRWRTLVIPFLFWNIAVLCFYAVLQSIPATAAYFNSENASVLTFGPFEVVNSILGLTHGPIAYQFWFIRDLIVLVLLTPILYVALRFAAVPFLLVLCAFWISGSWPLPYPGILSILFFAVGSALSLRKIKPLFSDSKFVSLVFGLLAFGMLTISALHSDKLHDFDQTQGDIFHKMGIVCGLVCVLALGDLAAQSPGFISRSLTQLQRASFFVFATHEPLSTIVRKLAFKLLPMTPVMSLVYYLVIPLFVVVVTTILYFALDRLFPKFISFVTGGRGA